MAKFDVEGLDNLMDDLSLLQVDRIAPVMLEEAVPILEKNVKKKASLHRDTGDMQQSIKKTGAMRGQDSYYICVRPTGKDEKGVRNMEKAAYLEYGTSKQAATPFLDPAVRESEEAVCQKMQQVFEREVGTE